MSVVVKAVEKVVDTVAKTVEAVIKDPLPTLLVIAGQSVGIPSYVTQAAITAARGGDLEDVAKSVAISVATPTVAAKLAPTVSTAVSSVVTNEAAAQALTAATSQSLVAGSLTAATGGDWEQAAAGAFAGSMAATGYDKYVAPEVAAQAKSMGLSAETHANIQGALKSGVASGTGAIAQGGDFATGFANAVVESGWDNLTAKATEGLQDVKKTFLKDSDIKDNKPTFAGVSDSWVDQIPKGQYAQSKTTGTSTEDGSDLLAEIDALPKNPYYGRQLGEAFAAADGIDGLDISAPSSVSSLKGFQTLSGEIGDPVVKVTDKDGVTTYERNIIKTDPSGKETGYKIVFDPETNQFNYDYGDTVTDAAGNTIGAGVVSSKTRPGTTLDDLKKAAFSGNAADLSALTEFGQLPTSVDTTKPKIESGLLSSKDINRILSKADESSAAAAEARLAASVNPTPENIAAAEQAELTAELDKKALDSLAKTDVPSDMEGETFAAPTIEQTNENILKAILGGGETTGAPTPVAGQTGQDLLTVEGLQEAGLGDFSSFEGAGGISDPIDTQQGPLGTMTSNVPMPQTMQRPMSGAPMPQFGAPMPQGGLQFSTFNRVGTPVYFDGAPSALSALGPLSELDMQSIMMMSPEEYAARTKSANIFRVARGGLIALNKKR